MAIPRNLANIAPHMNASSTELTINDNSADLDFRVEADTNQYAIFVDAGANKLNMMSNAGRGDINAYGRLTTSGSISDGSVISDITSRVYYVNPSTGSDTTGNGSVGSPFQTFNRAAAMIPKLLMGGNSYTIQFAAGTFSQPDTALLSGISGQGTVTIRGDSTAGTVINLNGNRFEVSNCNCTINFSNITINNNTASWTIIVNNSNYVDIQSTVSCTKDGSLGWNWGIGFSNGSKGSFAGTMTLASGATAGLGGVLVLSTNSWCSFSGTITKSGSKFGGVAIAIDKNSTFYYGGTVNNFSTGVVFYQHYGDSSGGSITFSYGAITNCTVGVEFSRGVTAGAYAMPSMSGNTTNYDYSNVLNGTGDFSQTSKLLVGYTASNGGYNLQVNSQIFATSSTIATSDGRYKEQVVPLSNALDLIEKLNPVQFKWKPHEVHNFDTENVQVGFIAQEVMQAMADKPYLNSIIKLNKREIKSPDIEIITLEPGIPPTFDELGQMIDPGKKPITEEKIISPAKYDEFYGIAESNLVALLTKAIQELKAELDAVKSELQILKAN